MNVRQSRRIGVVCVLAIVTLVSGAQEGPADSDRDLRSRMAGAWQSTPAKPHPHSDRDSQRENKDQSQQPQSEKGARPAVASSQPTFRGLGLDEIARRMAQLDQVLYFTGDLCVMAADGRQVILNVQYQGGVARRSDVSTGMAMPGELSIEDGKLALRIPSMNITVYYRRLDEVPESVRLDPYPLGTRELNDAQRAAIQNEIARRTQRDQEVRFKVLEVNKKGRTGAESTAVRNMASVDQENTRRMIELIRDVGWLSKARFGSETQLGAFLIVQHSGNLRLMLTVLPLIEAEAKNDPQGQSYALLYDRLQLRLGRKQRYGTQAQTNPDGSVTIGRLEDRSRVDEWRGEMGLGPLADYAQLMAKGYGVEVTIGD